MAAKKEEVKTVKISELIPDDLNANRGTERGDYQLTKSLEKHGAGRSVLIDKHGRLIAGNKTAAKFGELGLEDVIVVQTDGKKLVAVQRVDIDLDSPQGRELAIADNRTGELNLNWDPESLDELIKQGVDLDQFWRPDELDELLNGIEDASTELQDSAIEDSPYSRKIDSPIYEPKGDKPTVSELFDTSRTDELLAEIDAADIPDEIAEFLRHAARRHTVFTFDKIAEFYAHADKPVQELMENSALVVIDFQKAIELGFVKLTEEIANQFLEDYPDDDEE